MVEVTSHPEKQPILFERRDVITGLNDISPFDSPVSLVSSSSPFSSLLNSGNLSGCFKLWRALNELITG